MSLLLESSLSICSWCKCGSTDLFLPSAINLWDQFRPNKPETSFSIRVTDYAWHGYFFTISRTLNKPIKIKKPHTDVLSALSTWWMAHRPWEADRMSSHRRLAFVAFRVLFEEASPLNSYPSPWRTFWLSSLPFLPFHRHRPSWVLPLSAHAPRYVRFCYIRCYHVGMSLENQFPHRLYYIIWIRQ